MDISYIILGHKEPLQIKRLVNRLTCANSFFYIHIDKRVDITPFKTALAEEPGVYFLEKRENGTWGDIGIVRATLHALKIILEDGRNGYCVLLSGQDYPIKSNENIARVLRANEGISFADTWALPYEKWYNGGFYRIEYYKYNVPDGENNYLLLPPLFSKDFQNDRKANVRRIGKLLLKGKVPFQLFRKRNFPHGIKPYGGSQWWAITTHMARQVISFTEEKKLYLKFHKFTLLADEIFFQSLIMHFSVLEKTAVKPSLTYLRFESTESAHPATFSSQNLNELKAVSTAKPEKLFARKFDYNDPVLKLFDVFNV
jgi:hypothetical protein